MSSDRQTSSEQAPAGVTDDGKQFPARIGIIGAGRGGTALLRMLREVPDVTVVGICDIDPRATGLEEARRHGIAVYSGAEALVSSQPMDWLINVSHTSVARRILLGETVKHIRIIDGDVSELIWRILVAFDTEVIGGEEQNGGIPLRARAIRTLVWKVVSETADMVQQAHDRLAGIAFRDPLTGLYTRRLLLEFLDKEISNSLRSGRPLSLLLLDLDWFKVVNDDYGHDAGDEILRRFSALMIDHGRAGDMIARYGGEEFVIVLPGCGLGAAMEFAEHLQGRCARELNRPDGKPQTVSIGVAAFEAEGNAIRSDGVTDIRQAMLQAADEALYAAKGAGRNRVSATRAVA
jgi:diguanylate cyclase (GGDEF)-like protein